MGSNRIDHLEQARVNLERMQKLLETVDEQRETFDSEDDWRSLRDCIAYAATILKEHHKNMVHVYAVHKKTEGDPPVKKKKRR